MASPLSHFAINSDDVARARRFYERVFGWSFEAWGPPEFFQIDTGGGGESSHVRGALQKRRDLIEGTRTVGFECTFAVDDVDETVSAVAENGGRILMEKTAIAGVGELVFFEDPEGNIVGAMRYDPSTD